MSRLRPTLSHVFIGAIVGTAAVVGVGFAVFQERARVSILAAAERQREADARRVEASLTRELARAQRALADVDRALHAGTLDADDPLAVEAELFRDLAAEPRLEEVTFTRAEAPRAAGEAEHELEDDLPWQTSLTRAHDGTLSTRVARKAGEAFAIFLRSHGKGGPFGVEPFHEVGPGSDPTEHPTFSVLAAPERRGRAIWSDLHYAEADRDVAAERRRIVLTIQRSVADAQGRFLGVARVGMLTDELDAIVRSRFDGAVDDPRVVALLAVSGPAHEAHLVARVDPSDKLRTIGDDLRFVSERPPREIAALLASPLAKALDPVHPNASGVVSVGGARHLATIRELSIAQGGTEGWFVAVVVPEAYYTRELDEFRRMFVTGSALVFALVVTIGALAINAVRRGVGRAVAKTAGMRRFDFAPEEAHSRLAEIDEVLAGLERAKTVARSMGKYIPLDLVRRLYETNQEPRLGGELATVSIMFTDIEGFTTLAEKLPPDRLAEKLGDYLETMTRAIRGTDGTIDKYVGDAVMALWNAPSEVLDHEKKACAAVLACLDATRTLYASKSWDGLPPLVTRFGLHTARVMVGHFGAPERLSYTALGDGVNLAARLEPLCKQYKVVVLASEDVVAKAKDAFAFRRVDRVAVKGKTRGIEVFELLGPVAEKRANDAAVHAYEEAFDAYLARDFGRAADLLAPHAETDGPSGVLIARCRGLAVDPPPEGWDGVHVAKSK